MSNSSLLPTLTGTKDTDRQVLFFLDDEHLFNACSSSKYYQSLCDSQFWFDKFYQTFGVNLNKYGNIDYKKLYKQLNRLDDEQILKFAIEQGYLPLVKKMIENLFGREDITRILDSALIYSAGTGNLDIMIYLIEQGADIHTKNDLTFILSAKKGYLDIVEYLIELPLEVGVNIHANDDSALTYASEYGHLDVVKYLVTKGANIHANHDQALIYAAERGYLDVLKYLVEQGADIHVHNDTALALAAYLGHLDVVEYLIASGANYRVLRNPSNQIKDIINRYKQNIKRLKMTTEKCEAITKKGIRCKNNAKDGSIYCGLHNKL